jgi:hypothetical protein
MTLVQSAEIVARVALRSVSSSARSDELYDPMAGSASIVPDWPVGAAEVPQPFRLRIGRVNAMVSDICVAETPAIAGASAEGAGDVAPGDELAGALEVGDDDGELLAEVEGDPPGMAVADRAGVSGEAVGAGVAERPDGRPRVPGGAVPEHAATTSASASGRMRITGTTRARGVAFLLLPP